MTAHRQWAEARREFAQAFAWFGGHGPVDWPRSPKRYQWAALAHVYVRTYYRAHPAREWWWR